MHVKLHLPYSIACKRDTDMNMWVHGGNKKPHGKISVKLCLTIEEKIGVLGQLSSFFLEIASATVNYQWKVVISFKPPI